MLISEFDLCKREWLELVFADRNKQYGAYELRNRYSDIMLRAIAITVFSVSALAVTANIISRHNRHQLVEPPVVTQVTLHPDLVVKMPEKVKPKVDQPKQEAAPKAATPIKTQQYIPFVVKPDDKATDPPKALEENVAVAQQTNDTPGSVNGDNVDPGLNTGPGGPGNAPVTETNEPVGIGGLEVMPEPVGGQAAWAKFLQKNLRFPGMAQDQGVSGRVFMTFIIEKDGHLSAIKVLRGAGYGFDEEALRVLKLAPAWKPGVQNGRNVRVQFTLPINFQLSNNE